MNSTFLTNGAIYGGALFVYKSRVIIENCRFDKNYAQRGGAVYLEGLTNIDINNCIFTNNFALNGGGSLALI